MKSSRLCIALIAIAVTASCAVTLHAALKVQPEKENVVASRLEGSWRLNADLTQRLEGTDKPHQSENPRGLISFVADEAIATQVPAKYEHFLSDKIIYLAGTMIWRGARHPFILIEHKGNPCVVYFRERDGDPMGDAESFYLMLAQAKEKKQDILFIGGDFNNQPFAAHDRVQDQTGAK